MLTQMDETDQTRGSSQKAGVWTVTDKDKAGSGGLESEQED